MFSQGKKADSQPAGQQKKRISGLLWAGGVLLAVLVLGFILLGTGQDLPSALLRTGAALWGGGEFPQILAFGEDLDGLLEDGNYTMTLSCSGETEFSLVTDYARDDRILAGTLEAGDALFAYSIDAEALQFTAPGKFSHVYGVKLEQLGQLLENPLFSPLLEEFRGSGELIAEDGRETIFRNRVGEALDAFWQSVKIRELGDEDFNDRRCRVYEITWSDQAAGKLLSALGTFPEVGESVRTLITRLGSECKCYVNKRGYIAGVEFAGAGARCQLILEGRKNPWDELTFRVMPDHGENLVYTGGLERSGSELQLCLENREGIFLQLWYDDASGEFRVRTRDDHWLFSGGIQTGEKLTLQLMWGKAGLRQMELTMAPLRTEPAPLSEAYIDLLDMNMADITRFLLDLG